MIAKSKDSTKERLTIYTVSMARLLFSCSGKKKKLSKNGQANETIGIIIIQPASPWKFCASLNSKQELVTMESTIT